MNCLLSEEMIRREVIAAIVDHHGGDMNMVRDVDVAVAHVDGSHSGSMRVRWKGCASTRLFSADDREKSLDDFRREVIDPLVARLMLRVEPAPVNEDR